jgi:hypothetical protein
MEQDAENPTHILFCLAVRAIANFHCNPMLPHLTRRMSDWAPSESTSLENWAQRLILTSGQIDQLYWASNSKSRLPSVTGICALFLKSLPAEGIYYGTLA